MTTRKEIRDQVKAQIQTAYTGEVSSGRLTHTGSLTEFIDIFFDEGENVEDGIQQHTEAIIGVGVHKTGIVTDDDLDAMAALAESGISSDPSLNGLVHGIQRAGFSYTPQGQTVYDSFIQNYIVIYEE